MTTGATGEDIVSQIRRSCRDFLRNLSAYIYEYQQRTVKIEEEEPGQLGQLPEHIGFLLEEGNYQDGTEAGKNSLRIYISITISLFDENGEMTNCYRPGPGSSAALVDFYEKLDQCYDPQYEEPTDEDRSLYRELTKTLKEVSFRDHFHGSAFQQSTHSASARFAARIHEFLIYFLVENFNDSDLKGEFCAAPKECAMADTTYSRFLFQSIDIVSFQRKSPLVGTFDILVAVGIPDLVSPKPSSP